MIELRMRDFFNGDSWLDAIPEASDYACGTQCCFAGFGPYALKNTLDIDETWDDYTNRTFGTGHLEFEFLFSSLWINDKFQAAARALTLLEDSAAYGRFEELYDDDEEMAFSLRFQVDLTPEQLTAELKKYV